jgi:hypothetical protein
MAKLIPMIGNTYGFWKVLDRDVNDKRGGRQFLCRCLCGGGDCTCIRVVSGHSLRRGNTLSCGRLTRGNHVGKVLAARRAAVQEIAGLLARLNEIVQQFGLADRAPRKRK